MPKCDHAFFISDTFSGAEVKLQTVLAGSVDTDLLEFIMTGAERQTQDIHDSASSYFTAAYLKNAVFSQHSFFHSVVVCKKLSQ